MRRAILGKVDFGALRSMSDGSDGLFNRVADADTLPVLHQTVLKGIGSSQPEVIRVWLSRTWHCESL